MRRTSVLLSLLVALAFSLPTTVLAGWRVDGNVWRDEYTPVLRIGLVQGYVEGYSAALTVAPLYSCLALSSTPNDCFSVAADGIAKNTPSFSGITYGQLRDGVDAFYGDYRNRKIELPGAMSYIVKSIRGANADELQTMVEAMRKYSAPN